MRVQWRGALSMLAVALAILLPAEGRAQDHPYTEGSVWQVTYVKTAPGHYEDYLRDLAGGWKRVNDAAIQAGHVLSYKILTAPASNRDDWDLMLLVEVPNMAALDDGFAKYDPIVAQVFGSLPESQQATVRRSELRTIMGDKVAREITLK
ncbi:MAG: hypothetical protein ACRELU_03870 [Gemmatimonadota bacterium]